MASNLNQVFNKFAGKEVQATETVHQTKFGPITEVDISPADKVLTELRKAIHDMGLTLRVWLPGTFGTMDYQPNRVNVNVDKGADGKYRIGSNFNMG